MKARCSELNFYRYRLLVRIEGFRIERLLQKAFEGGIALRSLRMISDTCAEGWIAADDLKSLRKLAKSLYRIKVIDRRGPEQKIRQAAGKPVAVIGTILAAGIVIVQSLFISEIRIDGYRAIPEVELRRCLEEAGVSPGVFRPSVNWQKAEESLEGTFPQLSWVQLVYDGRVIYLNVSESQSKIISENADKNPDIYTPAQAKEKDCVSIYADCSGYIESVSTLWGLAKVEPGDFVKKGQELISGVVPMEPTTFEEGWPTEYYVRARGEIIARVPYHEVFSQERYVRESGTRVQGENHDGDTDVNIVTNRREKTKEQAEAVVNQQIRLWAKENLPEKAEIINKSLNFCYKKNIIEVGVTLEVRREIGIEKEIPVGQENSDN